MDIGLHHIITVDGKVFGAYWDVFNPNLALGNVHQIMIFEELIPLDQLFSRLNESISTETFNGRFYLAEKKQQLYKFDANYDVPVKALDEDVRVRQFVFVSDGRPWAVCQLEEDVLVGANRTSRFAFTSSVIVNNQQNIATNLWNINVGKFNIKYSAMLYPVEEYESVTLATKDSSLGPTSADRDIAESLAQGYALNPEYIISGNKIGIRLVATNNTDVAGIKGIFIRILWNIGIMVYIDSVTFGDTTIPSLTLVKGHELKLLFGLNFKEVTP